MSALTPTSLPAPPITRTCRQRPCSRPAPSAQPVEAPAPRPRSGIAGLPAHGLWPELTVATGSSRSSFVRTALGYLCPCRHSRALKPLWFGRTLARYLVTPDLGSAFTFYQTSEFGLQKSGKLTAITARQLEELYSFSRSARHARHARTSTRGALSKDPGHGGGVRLLTARRPNQIRLRPAPARKGRKEGQAPTEAEAAEQHPADSRAHTGTRRHLYSAFFQGPYINSCGLAGTHTARIGARGPCRAGCRRLNAAPPGAHKPGPALARTGGPR